ncbi:MAG: TlpA family protein disulfide reductase [Chitinophagaceae bacterium]
MKKFLCFCLSYIALTASAQQIEIGQVAPPLEIASVVGKTVPADFYKGNYLVLDFWATWCAPCIAGFPHLNELSKKFKSDSIVFAAISYEEEEKIERFFKIRKEFELHFHKLVDVPDTVRKTRYFPGRTFINYQVSGIPTTVIIDPKGKIKWIGNAHSLTEDLIRKAISTDVLLNKGVSEAHDESQTTAKARLDSLQIGSFLIKSGVAPKPYPGYSMMGIGMAGYEGEKIDKILLHLRGWHHKQTDTLLFAGKLPYVEFNIRGNKEASKDSLILASTKAMEEMYGLHITIENRNYEVVKLILKEPKKLLKNAEAFDEQSNKSSSMPGKEHFVAVNFKWSSLASGILKYIIPDEIFVLSPENEELVKGRKFDFRIPIKDYNTVEKFLKKEYGIEMKRELQTLPTLVIKPAI